MGATMARSTDSQADGEAPRSGRLVREQAGDQAGRDYLDGERVLRAERLIARDMRYLLVPAAAQLEDDQLRLVSVRHDDPVRLDAEPLICGLLQGAIEHLRAL